MKNILLVAKREYLRTVRKKSFWLTTLFFPVFIVGVGYLSGASSVSVENMVAETIANLRNLVIMDESGIIEQEQYADVAKFVTDKQEGIDMVKTAQTPSFFYFPADFVTSKKIEVYIQDQGMLGNPAFSDTVTKMVRQSILSEIADPAKIALYYENYSVDLTAYNPQGEVIDSGFARLIVPGISVIVYFILIQFASSYLLLSVAEEKENRMIETILSLVKPRDLIWGKIMGLLGVVVTQVTFLALLAVIGVSAIGTQIPLDLSEIKVTSTQIIGGLFYTICGFLILANTMVGVGAAMPTYKEAQSSSSVFIILSIFPVWLATAIMADPSGPAAMFSSYFPLSAGMILLFRNALGELSALETMVSSVVLLTYVAISFYLAFKMFEYGSLEYAQKVSVRDWFRSLLPKR